jgi:hypothetical protein
MEMKRGAFSMIQNSNDGDCKGNSRNLHDPRKFACWNLWWRQCSPLSSISRVLFTSNSFRKAKQATKLIMRKYWSGYVKLYVEKGMNFGPMIGFSIMIMFRLIRPCQAVSGTKIDYWSGTPIRLPWLGSKWLLAVSKNKVCLKGMKNSGYWRHPPPKKMTALKAIPQQEFQKCFQQHQHGGTKCVAAKEEYVEGNTLSRF